MRSSVLSSVLFCHRELHVVGGTGGLSGCAGGSIAGALVCAVCVAAGFGFVCGSRGGVRCAMGIGFGIYHAQRKLTGTYYTSYSQT